VHRLHRRHLQLDQQRHQLHELHRRHLQLDQQRHQLHELHRRHLQLGQQRHQLHELCGGVLRRSRHLRDDGLQRDDQPGLQGVSELPGPDG
jgi:hypothetical protein